MHTGLLPMKLQLFAEGTAGKSTAEGGPNSVQQGVQGAQGTQQQTTPEFDYEKLAGLISGKQSVAEDTVLKNYFKQQGLSQEEVTQAIGAFKKQKAEKTVNTDEIQTQLKETQQMARQAVLEKEATIAALELGIEPKAVSYLIKMADLSDVMSDDGKTNQENLKKALNKVLEDIPQLKTNIQATGGFHVGNTTGTQGQATDDQLNAIFGV